MKTQRELTSSQCTSAADIQRHIDELAETGGRLILPETEILLDRGLELRGGVELVGCGEATVLRKGPGRVYPLAGYHNYGMFDVPLESTAGLEVGMTVSVSDSKRGGFYSTFARITWIDDNWVGLDRGIEADYGANDQPRLTTAYPLVFAHDAAGVAVRDMTLDGNRSDNPTPMNACRGGAVYFARCSDIEVTGVAERDYNGEGLSFQMCRDMSIRNCAFNDNAGNGLHPGAGGTTVLFEDCVADGNARAGLFFCVRANHMTVKGCSFRRNGREGVTVGVRDCWNLIESCDVSDNDGPGIALRNIPRPSEMHSCVVRGCKIEGNARTAGQAQVEILGDAHDIIIERNSIRPSRDRGSAGVYVAASAGAVFLADNSFADCDERAGQGEFTDSRPIFECGCDVQAPQPRWLGPVGA